MREIRDPDHLNATRPLSKDDFWENQLMFCVKKNLYFTAFNWLTDSIHQILVKSVRASLNLSIDDVTCVHCATISAWLFIQQVSVLYLFLFYFFLPVASRRSQQNSPLYFLLPVLHEKLLKRDLKSAKKPRITISEQSRSRLKVSAVSMWCNAAARRRQEAAHRLHFSSPNRKMLQEMLLVTVCFMWGDNLNHAACLRFCDGCDENVEMWNWKVKSGNWTCYNGCLFCSEVIFSPRFLSHTPSRINRWLVCCIITVHKPKKVNKYTK